MTQHLTSVSAMSRNSDADLLRRIAAVTQAEVSRVAGIEKTAVHRIFTGDRGVTLAELERFVNALGLALVEADGGDVVSVPKSEFEAMRVLALKGLDR